MTSGGRWVVMPPPPSAQRRKNPAIDRRRKVFTFLVCFCGATLVLGLLPGLRLFLWVHLLADVVLAAMVALLLALRGMSEAPVRPAGARAQYNTGHAAYASGLPGRFEPAGHGYRLLPETMEAPLSAPLQADPVSIKVYREDDAPAVRLGRTADPQSLALNRSYDSGLISSPEPKSIKVVRSIGGPAAPRSRMFLDEEEDFLQVQGM